MIYAIILILFIMNRINNALNNLEHKQKILCYDLLILSKKLHEEKIKLLN